MIPPFFVLLPPQMVIHLQTVSTPGASLGVPVVDSSIQTRITISFQFQGSYDLCVRPNGASSLQTVGGGPLSVTGISSAVRPAVLSSPLRVSFDPSDTP